MSLSQAAPALVSLKVHRTADEIISMDLGDSACGAIQSLSLSTKNQPEVSGEDPSDELQAVREVLEQQCFSLVAFRNLMLDSKKIRQESLRRFHAQAKVIEGRLGTLSSELFKRIHDVNHRIGIISRTLAPRPTFRGLQPPNEFGRITGIDVADDLIALTTTSGHLLILERDTFQVHHKVLHNENEALFCPIFTHRRGFLSLFFITSGRQLMFSAPYKSEPFLCLDKKVECYAITDNTILRDGFDVVSGQIQGITFYGFDLDNPRLLRALGETKNIRGTVTQLVVDNQRISVYALTSKCIFYAISGTSYNVVSSMQFQTPLMQLTLTTLFIVFSRAPNDIIVAERGRDKFHQITEITIPQGLRRLCCSEKEILIIRKDQGVERRTLCDPLNACRICEPEAADYDPQEYIGTIYASHNTVYISHGNRLSLWS